jgi:hypothetical protein
MVERPLKRGSRHAKCFTWPSLDSGEHNCNGHAQVRMTVYSTNQSGLNSLVKGIYKHTRRREQGDKRQGERYDRYPELHEL